MAFGFESGDIDKMLKDSPYSITIGAVTRQCFFTSRDDVSDSGGATPQILHLEIATVKKADFPEIPQSEILTISTSLPDGTITQTTQYSVLQALESADGMMVDIYLQRATDEAVAESPSLTAAKQYADQKDALILTTAKDYTDAALAQLPSEHDYTQDIAAGDAATLATAKQYADASASEALSEAKTFATDSIAALPSQHNFAADIAAGDAATLSAARDYSDAGDTATLTAAKEHTDSAIAAIPVPHDYTQDIATGDAATLSAAHDYADAGDTAALTAAKEHTDSAIAAIPVPHDYTQDIATGDAATLSAAHDYADAGDEATLGLAKAYADGLPKGAGGLWTPDTPPENSDARSDEFNDAALASKWLLRTAPAQWDVNATLPSMLYGKLAKDEMLNIEQTCAIEDNLALTACCYVHGWANYHSFVIGFATANDVDAIEFGIQDSATPLTLTNFFCSQRNGGNWQYNVALSQIPNFGKFYLHVQKTGGNYSPFFSLDGISFMPMLYNGSAAIIAKVFSPTKIYIKLAGPASVVPSIRIACDWVRFNWMSL